MTETWRRSQLSFIVVILANALSLVVIWWTGWRAHVLLIAYWLETGAVTAVAFAKIRCAEGQDDPEEIRSWMAFDGKPPEAYVGEDNRTIADALLLTFVGPWFAFGFIVVVLGFTDVFEVAAPGTVALAAAGFVLPHVFAYRYEYVGLAEYERRGPVSLMVEPVPRHWIFIFTVIFGVGATRFAGSPIGAIVVLIFFKTCADLLAHRRERKRALRASPPESRDPAGESAAAADEEN